MLKKFMLALLICLGIGSMAQETFAYVPWSRSTSTTYASYRSTWCIPSGSYTLTFYNWTGLTWPKTNFVDFDGVPRSISKQDYLDRIQRIFDVDYNTLGFGRTFTLNATIVDVDTTDAIFTNSSFSGVEICNISDAYAYRQDSANRFRVRMFQASSYAQLKGYFSHEFDHALGFMHKDQGAGGAYYGNNSLSFAPMLYGIPPTNAELTEDSINGIDTLYETSNTSLYLKVTGNISTANSSFYSNGYAEAYLIDSQTNNIWYQAPIDTAGYFEFRVRKLHAPGYYFKLLVCSSGSNYHQKYPYHGLTKNAQTVYRCINTHTSSDANKPPNATYWAVESTNYSPRSMEWASGKTYTNVSEGTDIAWSLSTIPVTGLGAIVNIPNIAISSGSYWNVKSLREVQTNSGIIMLYKDPTK